MSPRAAWRLEGLGFEQVYDYVAGKADWGAAGLPREGAAAGAPSAGDAADKDAPTCAPGESVPDVRDRLAGWGWDTCVVVNDERVVLGRLGRRALREAAGSVEDAMTPGPGTVRPNLALAALSERMERRNLTSVIVTTSDGRLVGVVRRST